MSRDLPLIVEPLPPFHHPRLSRSFGKRQQPKEAPKPAGGWVMPAKAEKLAGGDGCKPAVPNPFRRTSGIVLAVPMPIYGGHGEPNRERPPMGAEKPAL
jgi:hypothetical protein